MPIGDDPLASYSYHVDIKGVTIAQFQAVDGLSVSTSVIEYRSNSLKGLQSVRKLPGQVNYPDITLSRGKVTDNAFWTWMKLVTDGKIDEARTEGSIVLFDYARAGIINTFNFHKGWPSQVGVGGLNAEGNEVLLENITITHERLEIA